MPDAFSLGMYAVVVVLLLLNFYHYRKVKLLEREVLTLKQEGEYIKKQVMRLKSEVD